MIHYITSNGIGNAWVANELSRVAAAGIPFKLHALRSPGKLLHGSPWALLLNDETRTLYPIVWTRMLWAIVVAPIRYRSRFLAAFWNALTGERESVRVRLKGILHFFVALTWVASMKRSKEPVTHIHSQWINSCGTVGMYGAWLLGVPFSFTGHAADLFRERCALRDKIRRAEFIVCISEFHRRFFLAEGARPEQLFIAYCGIDQSWFYPRSCSASESAHELRILASGRLVEKKGLSYLIDACSLLRDRGIRFRCTIGGSGELEADLRAQVCNLGLDPAVTITGQALQQERIVEFMHAGDVYALPCVWASDGDVDGLPQMLMEAMACGLPAISTRLVGIPDLIDDGVSGLLVEPNDPVALADALQRMCDPALRKRLAAAGRAAVADRFDLNHSLEPLIQRFATRLSLVPHS